MVEPRLKAVLLCNKFLAIQNGITLEIDMDNEINKKFFELNQDAVENYYKKVAQESALLKVNDMINLDFISIEDRKYWSQVKTELEKI